MPPPVLTLYIRTYCHLCDEMRAAIAALRGRFRFELVEIDVDEDDELEARLGEKIPVLMWGDREICHYFFDAAAFARIFEKDS